MKNTTETMASSCWVNKNYIDHRDEEKRGQKLLLYRTNIILTSKNCLESINMRAKQWDEQHRENGNNWGGFNRGFMSHDEYPRGLRIAIKLCKSKLKLGTKCNRQQNFKNFTFAFACTERCPFWIIYSRLHVNTFQMRSLGAVSDIQARRGEKSFFKCSMNETNRQKAKCLLFHSHKISTRRKMAASDDERLK
jgi:hypothetical protein